MYTVHYELYIAHCTSTCTVYNVNGMYKCALYNVNCTLYSVHLYIRNIKISHRIYCQVYSIDGC